MFLSKFIRNRFVFLILPLLLSCTGFNLRTWPLPVSPNTHPIESYAGVDVFFKGGYIYHSGSNVSYTGTGKLEKNGKACSHSFLYLVAFGSSRIYDAKVNGAVNHIGAIEEDVLAILGGFYHRHCTIVIGEGK
ncbi:MAG TPA: TRL domain-containing protein [Leptospiraceae bacterium]|nr:TRL domain-containing protein [Leptospiraceae bacterium]HMW07301.1 TRL domain-containing protein [Leptospiraceae bacterium]HMX33744.1 TRL domain-containing protein [Leptospiraceae bacterium]HMY32881.1 TRL domain-containing protein [Leptospiraceae bacterium]HMZ65956.1 TRL domain-containing protein [Leptospiraceae bacterium]